MTTQEKQNILWEHMAGFQLYWNRASRNPVRMKPESSISISEAVSERILWATVTKHG